MAQLRLDFEEIKGKEAGRRPAGYYYLFFLFVGLTQWVNGEKNEEWKRVYVYSKPRSSQMELAGKESRMVRVPLCGGTQNRRDGMVQKYKEEKERDREREDKSRKGGGEDKP